MLLFGRHFNQFVVCQSCLLQFQARVILFQLNFPFLCLIQLDKMQTGLVLLKHYGKG